MEFYLSPSATHFWEVEDALALVDARIQAGFFLTMFQDSFLLKSYSKCEHFDLPIFIVTEEDLGKRIPILNWEMVTRRYVETGRPEDIVKTRIWHSDGILYQPAIRFQGYNREYALNIPDEIDVPSTICKYRDADILDRLNNLDNPQSINTRTLECRKSRSWLGLYQGGEPPCRSIFIRIDKILSIDELKSYAGVASVILHELAHAGLDTLMPEHLCFSTPISVGDTEAFTHIMEESIANLVAYKSIKSRGVNRLVSDIARFMFKQSFPYQLGARLGIDSSNRGFLLNNYVAKWYKAKLGGKYKIKNVRSWVSLIKGNAIFNDADIKNQTNTLF